ncbi:MAG: hypothetical protein GX926_01435, partial [Candidatus Magasanikbacteria bacterium]|nr:hypothetical protein [Candidatus Magasanikbacteria bacterium]
MNSSDIENEITNNVENEITQPLAEVLSKLGIELPKETEETIKKFIADNISEILANLDSKDVLEENTDDE